MSRKCADCRVALGGGARFLSKKLIHVSARNLIHVLDRNLIHVLDRNLIHVLDKNLIHVLQKSSSGRGKVLCSGGRFLFVLAATFLLLVRRPFLPNSR